MISPNYVFIYPSTSPFFVPLHSRVAAKDAQRHSTTEPSTALFFIVPCTHPLVQTTGLAMLSCKASFVGIQCTKLHLNLWCALLCLLAYTQVLTYMCVCLCFYVCTCSFASMLDQGFTMLGCMCKSWIWINSLDKEGSSFPWLVLNHCECKILTTVAYPVAGRLSVQTPPQGPFIRHLHDGMPNLSTYGVLTKVRYEHWSSATGVGEKPGTNHNTSTVTEKSVSSSMLEGIKSGSI